MSTHDVLQTIGLVATPITVLLAGWQLRLSRKQAQTAFEDQMAREYRELLGRFPTDAFDAAAEERILPPDENKALLQYFDLSNEQLRLAAEGRRVSEGTRDAWREGIEDNMKLPRFRTAWREIRRGLPKGHFTWLSKPPYTRADDDPLAVAGARSEVPEKQPSRRIE